MFRLSGGFYCGLSIGLLLALFCFWLWRPERQVNRHSENLFRNLERKNWAAVSDFIDSGYADQWNDDRSLLIERTRVALGYLRNLHLTVSDATCAIEDGKGKWRGKIRISAEGGELGTLAEQRINLLGSPFELEWRHVSGKPWDWKLVRVSNPELEIPSDF